MKKGRIRNALLGAVGVALAAIMLISVSPTSASAYDGGAGAGSGGGGGGSGSWGAITRWNYVNTWDQLVNSQYMLSNMNSSGAGARNASEAAEWFVRTSSGGQGLLDMCKGPNLVRIYYLGASGGIPIKPNSSTGTFTWTNPAGGDAVDQYAGSLNGRGVYVICVINPIETKTWTQPDSRDRNDGAGRTFTADTAWMTNVAPEADLLEDGVDVIGQPNLHDQGLTTVETAFGALKRTIGTSGGSGNYDARATQIQQAIDSDASKAHASVNLDAENRAGMAEGGVLTVTEQTKRGSITLTQSWKEQRSRQVTCDYRPGESDPIPNTCTYGDWTAWSETPGSRSFQSTSPAETSAVNTGFFQLLSVHCNPNEFNALTSRLTALGGPNAYELVSQTTGVDGTTTSVIKTAHFNNRGEAINSRRILGANLSSLAAEVRRTGQLGFYDKECNAQCVSNPSASSGASSANGALSNVSITSNNNANPGTHGGANLIKNGTTNSNYFEIFRDNDTNRITINTAYPRNNDPQLKYGGTFRNAANTGNVNIPASAPVSTTVTRWAEGTPDTNKSSAGGVFQMTAIGTTNQQLFQSTTGNVGVQKNFGTDTYSSPNSQVLNGFYRTFDVQSTWASEKDKPQVINVKWEYRPTVYTRFPGTVGFTANNSSAQIVANGEVVVDQAVDVKCYAQYGSYDRNLDLANRVQSSTGTGSTNTLDSAPLESPSGDNSWVTQSNLVIKFVRGVAE